jgi:hypothetical protein
VWLTARASSAGAAFTRARHRSLTFFVVVAGTASPVPEPTGSWLITRLAAHDSR